MATKRPKLITFFIGTQILLTFWHVFRYNLVIHEEHATQQLTHQYKKLIATKQELSKTLYSLGSPQAIHAFAKKEAMHTIRLDQIHTVNTHDQHRS